MNLSPAKRVTVLVRTLTNCHPCIGLSKRRYKSCHGRWANVRPRRREFHDYFVTRLPSSSLHPDPRSPLSSFHKLPRSASMPHTGKTTQSPTSFQATISVSPPPEALVPPTKILIKPELSTSQPLRNAPPASLTIKRPGAKDASPQNENQGAETANGDPQVFYFGIFDGHGGSECSAFLKDVLHEYIQDTVSAFELRSSLKKDREGYYPEDANPSPGNLPIVQGANSKQIGELEKTLVRDWKSLVGGYFKRFVPASFSHVGPDAHGKSSEDKGATIEEVLEYAFLRADLDFVSAQAARHDDELDQIGQPLYQDNILYGPRPVQPLKFSGFSRFKGGSTASVALISTPTATPFFGIPPPRQAIPITSNHHPSSPIEANRLRRYAATFVTDSFGEERMSGLANTRAFGDVQSKRIGVSAEPELRRVEMAPAEFSFLVLMSDGISGTLPDQEVVDIIKEAKTPDEGSREVVRFATEVAKEGDNATCLVVRLGGWERRLEGGLGSMGTKESREWRRQEATDPRRSRR
ncbi:PP2C family serine/threonine-protein phosphatase [Aspergillus tanneri]|uniref:PPM-type phosphatase domain-containing protein n=1 Tax=Aspergillus tanneri TaxID=1220188 RepID=A0A5M9MX90_9EURO|nr:uncharacterized protein ATNIH1004_000386 [Aspergillus tanneri]KAA8651498.1 hypothetical protein ATNIH1004_000386 [Aspergillus tanneri]